MLQKIIYWNINGSLRILHPISIMVISVLSLFVSFVDEDDASTYVKISLYATLSFLIIFNIILRSINILGSILLGLLAIALLASAILIYKKRMLHRQTYGCLLELTFLSLFLFISVIYGVKAIFSGFFVNLDVENKIGSVMELIQIVPYIFLVLFSSINLVIIRLKDME